MINFDKNKRNSQNLKFFLEENINELQDEL